MLSTALPTEIRGGVCTGPTKPKEDGATAHGPGRVTIISDRVFDFRDCPAKKQDEVISGVDGANVRLQRCVILGGIKAILAGNGDHPGSDMRFGHWEMEDCVIMGAGRRCPEVQDFVELTMRRCWIHNWGRAFDERVFAGWAHRGGRLVAEDCLFTQSGGIFSLGLCATLADIFSHIGQACNDEGLSGLLHWQTYMPGVCRGLTASTGGLVLGTRCYRNRRWIWLENCDPFIGSAEALQIVAGIDALMPEEGRKRLGSLVDMFTALGAA